MDEKEKNICKAAVELFGENSQLNVLKEELAESIAAICRLNRIDKTDPMSMLEIFDSVSEEIADIEIMLEQFRVMYPQLINKIEIRAIMTNSMRVLFILLLIVTKFPLYPLATPPCRIVQ